MSPEFIAAILGAVVGGLMSLIAQAWSERRSTLRKDHALAIGLFLKLLDMHANIAHLQRHLVEGRELARRDRIPLSAATAPLANHPDEIRLSTDEKAVVFSFGDLGLLNEVLNLDRTYNSMISLSERYEHMRATVSAVIRGVPDARGIVVKDLTVAQYEEIAATQFEMDQILHAWTDYTTLDEHAALSALHTLALHIRRRFQPSFRFDGAGIIAR